MPGAELAGLRVLVVEDEAAVAMLIEDMLEELGCAVAATAAELDEALAAVRAGGFDVALLDINLAGRSALAVAEALDAQGRPFAFASGYGAAGRGPWSDAPVLPKPFRKHDLAAVLQELARRR
jgi:CheY-like chemotaxis protein